MSDDRKYPYYRRIQRKNVWLIVMKEDPSDDFEVIAECMEWPHTQILLRALNHYRDTQDDEATP